MDFERNERSMELLNTVTLYFKTRNESNVLDTSQDTTPIYSSVNLTKWISLMESLEMEHEEHVLVALYQFQKEYDSMESKKQELNGYLNRFKEISMDGDIRRKESTDHTDEIIYLQNKWKSHTFHSIPEKTPLSTLTTLKSHHQHLVENDPTPHLSKYNHLPPNLIQSRHLLQSKQQELLDLKEKVKSIMFELE
jgi:hypothetical protein